MLRTHLCILLKVISLILFVSGSEGQDSTYYSNYYNYDLGDTAGEDQDKNEEENHEVQSEENPELSLNGNFRVLCTGDQIVLTILRQALPESLEIHIPKKMVSAKDCFRYNLGNTVVTYQVNRTCADLITLQHVGSSRFFRHRALLKHKRLTVSSSNPYSVVYTIVMECEQFGSVGGNGSFIFTSDDRIRAERRIFEHRIATGSMINNCKSENCPYGGSCLDENEVDGYYCICAYSDDCQLKCPKEYYGCDRGNTSNPGQQQLQCIRNGWLCDKRFDCKLKDDESHCVETWSTWGPWSKCKGGCEGGKQTRQRVCDVAFTPDPERCKIHKNALGCSRRCVDKGQIERENRTCKIVGCPTVQCSHHHMVAVIPRNGDMTDQEIHDRIQIGKDQQCQPTYNDTHLIFVIYLHKCNTTWKVDGEDIIYQNEIRFLPKLDQSSIIVRDFGKIYAVTCRFNRRHKVVIGHKRDGFGIGEVAALTFNEDDDKKWVGMEQNEPVDYFASGDGEFDFKMDLYKSDNFQEPYTRSDYPLRKPLREQLFVAVQFQSIDETVALHIERCRATPHALQKDLLNSYTFIENGCAVDETVRFFKSKQSAKFRTFSIEAFKFNDATKPHIFIQCDVIVCELDDSDCQPDCGENHSGSREKRSFAGGLQPIDDEPTYGHVIQGPIIVVDSNVESGLWENDKLLYQRAPQDVLTTDATPDASDSATGSPSVLFVYYALGGLACISFGVFIGILANRKFRSSPTAV
ncbi:uncharacterized protein LOC143463208 isoform X1 [Clavelina lepadiformis]|uniref:uncharacterized protein LOC143463208 isoform X1 n=1 Tax=Clavelina lepadiformis TaxID=159417 RepID=UPI0040438299